MAVGISFDFKKINCKAVLVVLSYRKYRGYAASDVSHLRNTEFVGGTVLSKLEIEIATWGSFRRGIAAVWTEDPWKGVSSQKPSQHAVG